MFLAETFFEGASFFGETDVRQVYGGGEAAVIDGEYRTFDPAFGVEFFDGKAEDGGVKLEHLCGELRHVRVGLFFFECHFDQDVFVRTAHDGSAVFVTWKVGFVSCKSKQ